MSTDTLQALLLAAAQQSMSIAIEGSNLFSDRTYTVRLPLGLAPDMLGVTLCPKQACRISINTSKLG